MQEVARAKKSTAGGLDGWAWNEIQALPLPLFFGLAILLELVETTGTWPQGLLDAYIAMIPKADGDFILLGQRPLSARLCTGCGLPFGLDICGSGLRGGCLDRCLVLVTVYLRLRLGSLLRWMLRRYLLGLVVISCMLWLLMSLSPLILLTGPFWDCALGRLALPDWFREVFSFHSQVRLRFKLAAGLEEPWCRDGGVPQKLSTYYGVHCGPVCRHLEALPDVKPQLHADNLKCSAERPGPLFHSARFTARYVRSVGQDVSPGKCVLLSTSKSVRKAMKLWDICGDGGFWKVQLDVRDLGGHLVSLFVLGLILFPRGLVTLLLVLLQLVLHLWVFRSSWGWFVVNIFLPVSMLPRPPVSPPRPLVPLGLPLCVQFGLLKCLLPKHLLSLTFLMGLLGLILLFTLFGPGFV